MAMDDHVLRLGLCLCLATALGSVAGCRDSPRPMAGGEMDGDGFRVLQYDTADCAARCIETETVAVLGDRDGPGFVERTSFAAQDSLGRYWLSQRPGVIKVFTSEGEFVQEVGRPGRGPMEFDLPEPRYTTSDGYVHVYDAGNLRESVISPEFDLIRDRALPGWIRDVAPLTGDRRAVNMILAEPNGTALPLHILNGREIETSFRSPPRGLVNPFNLQMAVTSNGTDRIATTSHNHYDIEVWNSQGDRVAAYRGPKLNQVEPKPGLFSRHDNPPPDAIRDLQFDEVGRLWVLRWEKRPDWQAFMEERRFPNGDRGLVPKDRDHPYAAWRTVLEVVNLPTAAVIAHEAYDEVYLTFVGDRMLLSGRLTEEGIPQVLITRLSLTSEERPPTAQAH